jgi:hypothetical protein
MQRFLFNSYVLAMHLMVLGDIRSQRAAGVLTAWAPEGVKPASPHLFENCWKRKRRSKFKKKELYKILIQKRRSISV